MIVYFIQGKSDNLVKIGICNNLKRRMIGLQTGNPHPLRVLRQLDVMDHERLERDLHDRFKDFSVQGEWFNLSSGCRRWIKSLKNEDGKVIDCQYYYHAKDLSRHSLGEKIL